MKTYSNKKIEKLKKQIVKLDNEIEDARRTTYLVCANCGKRNQVKSTIFYHSNYYDRCEGDYEGHETAFECKHCDVITRLIYDYEKYSELSYSGKKIIDFDNRDKDYPKEWVNP